MAKYRRWKTIKAFNEDMNITEKEFWKWAVVEGDLRVLKHPLCPKCVAVALSVSPLWYQRLAAMCNRKWRREFFEQAIKDPKSTVRAAAYKGAMGDEIVPKNGGWLLPYVVRHLVQHDVRTHNYFRGTFRWFRGEIDMSFEKFLEGEYDNG